MSRTQHGFEHLFTRDVPELAARARLYRHAATGGEVLSMECDDANKVFGITFRTPPADSSGIAHILEHSVLCGSRKYPVKEPFVELLKGSLQTFLNAFTFPDKTCYPVASQNLQDFRNLVDVYLDAVFHPRITPEIFGQEGWHYEADDPDGPLAFKGVVFNEMKGVYSSPDARIAEGSQQGLFPDTPYGLDSGGHPSHIPDLTFETFRRFHAAYYHPSNARVFFWGDDPAADRLRTIDACFREFSRIDPAPVLPAQPRFDAPRQRTLSFPAAEGSADATRALATVNWLLPDPLDPERTLAFEVLGDMLTGTPAAPLRKALTDSGLGEEVLHHLETGLREMYFSAGLRGLAPDRVPDMERLVLRTLEDIVRDGFPADLVAATMNTFEFRLRENNTGGWPRGLLVMLRALTTWLHGADPVEAIAFEAPLAALKARLAAAPRYFEDLVGKHLHGNPHRVTLALVPDTGLAAREEAGERARLDAAHAAMDGDARRAVVEAARAMHAAQERPDPPEALAAIPCLRLSDLDRSNTPLPMERDPGEPPVLLHDLATAGIVYLDAGFDLRALPADLLPYVPLFGRALLQTGTDREDFVAFSRRIGRTTGGVGAAAMAAASFTSRAAVPWLFMRGKALVDRAGDLLGVFDDALLRSRLEDHGRLLQLAREQKAGLEASLIPAGNGFVGRRLEACFSEAGGIEERMHGIEQLFFLRGLVAELERDGAAVSARLEALRRLLVRRTHMVVNLTAPGGDLPGLRDAARQWAGGLPGADRPAGEWPEAGGAGSETLALPSQVNYVGKAARLFADGQRFHGSMPVAVRYLNTTWMWERVRVQGGAYGGSCRLNRATGTFAYLSYRDPNIRRTLEVYDRTAGHLAAADVSEEEVRKSVIGAIGDLDRPMLPDAMGFASLVRHLTGDTDERRQQLRDEILGTTPADLRRFAGLLRRVAREGVVVVMGSPEALGRDAGALPPDARRTRLL